jgi:outer membrane receptor for Fe3+-dicitrate
MRARLLVFVLVSVGLYLESECAHAQSAPDNVQALPPIIVSPVATKPKPGVARAAQRTLRPTRPIVAQPVEVRQAPSPTLYPTTPVPGSGIDADKVPASVNMVDANQIEREHSANIANALEKFVPSVVVNEVAGNPFQPNVQFRGFVASPVSGTPQGLAVYQNGVRTRRSAIP